MWESLPCFIYNQRIKQEYILPVTWWQKYSKPLKQCASKPNPANGKFPTSQLTFFWSLCTGMTGGMKFTYLRIQVFWGVMLSLGKWLPTFEASWCLQNYGNQQSNSTLSHSKDLNSQLHQYENLKSHIFIFSYTACVFLLFFTEHGKKVRLEMKRMRNSWHIFHMRQTLHDFHSNSLSKWILQTFLSFFMRFW